MLFRECAEIYMVGHVFLFFFYGILAVLPVKVRCI